ncbi:TetR/AcrR family transcriptional regulator [Virgisporangium aurantiacum]
MPRTNDSRARTVRAAAELISERGVAGTGLRDVVAAAGTPRGSLSHHFPGGKDELVIEAVTWSALKLRERLDALAGGDPPATVAEVLAAMVRWWERGMLAVGFNGGCVVAATVVDGTGTDVRRAAQRAFESWIDPLTDIAEVDGLAPVDARRFAVTVVAAVEGALLLCRSGETLQPLHDVQSTMLTLAEALKTAPGPRGSRGDQRENN